MQPPSSKLQRNQPCPCGSGKKYKVCCLGRKEQAAAVDDQLPRLLQRAESLAKAGYLRQAEAIYRQILVYQPRHSGALERLGELLCQCFRREEGLHLMRRCAELYAQQGATPADWVRLALRLVQWRELECARICAQAAIQADPAHARAHYALALIHERRHQLDSAHAAAAHALASTPDDPSFALLMARLETRQGNLPGATARLQALIARGIAGPRLLRRAGRELGLLLDRQGRFDQAFQLIERVGQDELGEALSRGITPQAALQRIEHYRTVYSSRRTRALSRSVFQGSPAPAFLMGFVRSGTTLLEQVLAAHPQIITCDEEPIVYELRCEVERLYAGKADAASALAQMGDEQILHLRKFYWDRVEMRLGQRLSGRIFVDKNALNTLEIGLIDAIFPDAKVIFALRDPRDVCLSAFMQPYMLSDMTVHFLDWEGTADFYAAMMGLWLSLRDKLSLDFLEVRYEDTVDELQRQARRVLALVGAAWHPGVLDFHEQASRKIISTPSFADVSQPIHRRALHRWRNYAVPVQRVAPVLKPFITAFGYPEA